MKAHAQKFRPQLLSLEDRRCPAVSVRIIDGHILQVDGDRGNNAVIIAQDDDQITISGSGSGPMAFPGIDTVRVNTWAGDDNVAIRSHDAYKRLPEFTFDIDLGAGNDVFTLFVPPPAPDTPPPDSSAIPMREFEVQCGAGDDTVQSFLGQLDAPIGAPTGHIRERVCLDYDGDAGDDTFITEVRNVVMDAFNEIKIGGGRGNDLLTQRVDDVVIKAGVSFALDGGDGNDQIDIAAKWQVGAGATTLVELLGGRGADRVTGVWANHLAAGGQSNYTLDGGAGADTVAFSYRNAIVAGALDLTMAGGQGDDLLFETLLPEVQSGGSFTAHVDGGGGDDMNTSIIMPAVQRGGAFAASFDGGEGRDVLTGFVEDPDEMPSGTVDIAFMGGRGDDAVDVHVDMTGFSPESGRLHVAIDGGQGSDRMVFLLTGVTTRMSNAEFTLDGGSGEDFAIVSPLVDVMNVEHKVIMP